MSSVGNEPSDVAAENHAMTSFKRPPSLKPIIPVCVYIVLSCAGPSIVMPILPGQRKSYFSSDADAALWSSLFESVAAVCGLFLGGLFGLASDAFGRKKILIISCVVAFIPYPFQLYFQASNPWPFLALSNLCVAMGATQVGNAAIGFSIIADLFEKDVRLLPTIIYTMMYFVGLLFAPLPSLLHLDDFVTCVIANVILLGALVFVIVFFDETLPEERRKAIELRELENPLGPLRYIFKNKYLCAFAILAFCFMFPFYSGAAIDLYYFNKRIPSFDSTLNGALLASMAVWFLIAAFTLLPFLTRRLSPANVVLIGICSALFNSAAHCLMTRAWEPFVFLSPTNALVFLVMPLMSQMVSVTVSQNEQGVTLGTIAAVKGTATVLGPVAGSLLFSAGQYRMGEGRSFIELPYVVNSFVCVCGIFVIVLLLKPAMRAREASVVSEVTPLNA